MDQIEKICNVNFEELKNSNDVKVLKDAINKIKYPLCDLARLRQYRIRNFVDQRKRERPKHLENYKYDREISKAEEKEFDTIFFSSYFRRVFDLYLKSIDKSVKLQKEQANNGRNYYYGSVYNIDEGKQIDPSKSAELNQEKVVIATNKRAIALVFIPRWGDEDFEFGINPNNKIYLKEKYTGAYEKIFKNVKGYVYHVDPKYFQSDSRISLKEVIFVSKKSVSFSKKEIINDVRAALENSDIQIIKSENIKNQTERTTTSRVQSIYFHKKVFKTKEQCIAWIKRQNKDGSDFVFSKYDPPDKPGENYHKFRQFDPDPKKQKRFSKEGEIDRGVKFLYEF